ncbi:hypothetical protein JCM3765_004919 [Sporobolomyces pararoseus]
MSHSDSSLEIKQAPPRHLIPNYHNFGGVEEQTRVNTHSTGGPTRAQRATYRGDYNSEYAPRKVVTLSSGVLGQLAESLRPQKVLPYFMSDYAFKQSQGEPLASGDFKAAILMIAEQHSFYQSGGSGDMILKEHSVKLSEEAETWRKDVSSVYKKSRGTVRRVADSSRLNEACKKLRWNLLVTATYVCSGQLPTAQRVVHGDYDGILSSPPNVKVPGQGFVPHSASHSLARISRRYAPLIGYNGPEARQGGLEFI